MSKRSILLKFGMTVDDMASLLHDGSEHSGEQRLFVEHS
jgi:hypothetical protein